MFKVLLTVLSVVLLIDLWSFKKQISTPPVKMEIVQTLKKIQIIDPIEEIGKEEFDCLVRNIYFEARDQTIEGQYAVAEVVLNRTEDEEFPKTICEVVEQKTETVCQFSWFCDGKSDRMRDRKAIEVAKKVAMASLLEKTDYTDGAVFYHAEYVSPHWKNVKKTKKIQDHIFYTSI